MPSRETRVKLRNAIRGDATSEELYAIIQGAVGNVFYVSSVLGAAANDGLDPTRALATIDAAINQCADNNGDVIIVMPNHAESVTAASGITCDRVGVSIVGLGRGTDRPQITFATSTAATVVMSAANVTWHNMTFLGDIDALVVGFPVTAAWCGFFNCVFEDNGTDNALHWITLSADADYFQCVDCLNIGTATAGNTGFITMAAATGVQIKNLVSSGDFAAANIDMSAAAVDVLIENCKLENANAVDVCIEGFAAATGWVVKNSIRIATDAQVTGINTVGDLSLFENYQVNNSGETGLLVGTVSV